MTVLAVDPGARVSGIPQDVVQARLKSQQLAGLVRALVGQQHGNRIGPQPLIDVHLEDAAHNLGLLINRLGPSVVSDAVSVGGPPAGRRPCLAVPRLPRVDRSLKLSSSILPMAAMRQKVFMSMASMTTSSRIWCASTDLHECGGGVHPPAEAVGLPADDGVEVSAAGVGQHSLELGSLLRPSPADLMVAGSDCQPLALAVGFHLAYLF